MALTNDQITAQNFKDFYGQIRPYLNGQVPTFANQFSRSDLYSTSEKIIGSWTDGKPLYQKSFVNVTVPAKDSSSIVESNFNVDTFWVSCLGIAVLNEMAEYSDGVGVFVFINDPDGHTQNLSIANTSASRAGNKAWFTVCYTKTGDSAIKVGTGTDYSTDEQIIGSWIDGKPLYQKSYTGTCNANSMVVDANFNDTYIDNVVEMVAYSKQYNTSYHKYFWTNTYYQDANDSFRISVHPDNGLSISGGSNYPLKPYTYIITVRYTKTTD